MCARSSAISASLSAWLQPAISTVVPSLMYRHLRPVIGCVRTRGWTMSGCASWCDATVENSARIVEGYALSVVMTDGKTPEELHMKRNNAIVFALVVGT